MTKRRKYTSEFKREAVRLMASSLNDGIASEMLRRH